jgi:hypothetical protein
MNDKFQRLLLKSMIVLFIAAVTLSLVADVLRAASPAHLAIIAVLLSGTAYFIRERRSPRDQRTRSGAGGERTPVMPRSDR